MNPLDNIEGICNELSQKIQDAPDEQKPRLLKEALQNIIFNVQALRRWPFNGRFQGSSFVEASQKNDHPTPMAQITD
jgi:hypothetical protein